MIDLVLEMHWSNNPIPVDQLFAQPDYIFDVPLGLFTSLEPQVTEVNGKKGSVELNALDVDADPAGSAQQVKTELQNDISEIRSLSQTNELKISTKADQIDFETVKLQTEQNRISLLSKVDIQALALLTQLVDTKADQAYVNQQIAALVGTAPEALNTIYELAEALQNEQTIIEGLNQSVANRLRFDIATQALTEIQKQNARINIGAEKLGTAQQLISQITAQSLGAATSIQGEKADSALQSEDVAPVALSGLFSSLGGQNKIFDVIFNNFTIGPNSPITSADTLGQMLGKIQAQFNNSGANGLTWINANQIPGFTVNSPVVYESLKFAKKDGMLWIYGALQITGLLQQGVKLFNLNNPSYAIERFGNPIYELAVANFQITAYYNKALVSPTNATMLATCFMFNSDLYIKLQYQISSDGGSIIFSPQPLGKLTT